MKKVSIVLNVMFFVMTAMGSSFAAIINVPDDYTTIQAAIDAAVDGDHIVIADGTYSGSGNSDLTWDGSQKHLTVRSENGSTAVTIDCENTNSAFVFRYSDQSVLDQIQGLTIINGSASTGGAMQLYSVSPHISDCVFRSNVSETGLGFGGAVYCIDSSAEFYQCLFEDNHVGKNGGALYAFNSNLTIDQCQFQENSASAEGGAVGLCMDNSIISNSEFSLNRSGAGGAVHLSIAASHLISSEFSSNAATYGGAIKLAESEQAVIGGSGDSMNTFDSNNAPAGADLFYDGTVGNLVTATHNHFSGHPHSDVYVSPPTCFDVTAYVADTVLVYADLFVSPDGDNSNDGLTVASPLKTISEALARIAPTATQPLTIHLAPGEYSHTATDERFPLPLISDLSIVGDETSETTINAEGLGVTFMACCDSNFTLSHLTLIQPQPWTYRIMFKESSGILSHLNLGGAFEENSCIYGYLSDLSISNCTFDSNAGNLVYASRGDIDMDNCHITNIQRSGIVFYNGHLNMVDCVFESGSEQYIEVGRTTGEISQCQFSNFLSSEQDYLIAIYGSSTMTLSNCLMDNNSAVQGGAAVKVDDYSSVDLANCTFTGNTYEHEDAGLLFLDDSIVNVTNTIFWNNAGNLLADESSDSILNISYSNIQGGYDGEGNINSDPLFTDTDDYHLLSGSPCIDTGTDRNAPSIDRDGNLRPGGGTWDMGAFEFDGFSGPSRTFLQMPSRLFSPGDIFSADATFWNNDGQSYQAAPFFVLLQVGDTYLFLPEFNAFSYYSIDLPGEDSVINLIPEFTWPAGAGEGSASLLAALTNPQMTDLQWNLVIYDFSWSE